MLRLVLMTHAARQQADSSELSSAVNWFLSIMKATQLALFAFMEMVEEGGGEERWGVT